MWIIIGASLLGIYIHFKRYKRQAVKVPALTHIPFIHSVQYPINPLVINFTNYHWNISYHLGVAKFIQEFLDTDLLHCKGDSFGSIVSTALHLDIPIEDVYNYFKHSIYHENLLVFLWNYKNCYRNLIRTFFNTPIQDQPTYIYTQLSYDKCKCVEVQPVNYTEFLKIAYNTPFPSCIPKYIQHHGYMMDSYWNRPILEPASINISLHDHSSFPTPIDLQIKSWFHPKSKETLDLLYNIGYAKAFLFFHSQSSMCSYFKTAPNIKNIQRSYVLQQQVEDWLNVLNSN